MITNEDLPKCKDLIFCSNQLQEKCADCVIAKLQQAIANSAKQELKRERVKHELNAS